MINWKEQVCERTNHRPKTEREAKHLIKELYLGGMSYKEIADLLGVAWSTIRYLLQSLQVQPRPRGGPNRCTNNHLERSEDEC